MEYGGSVRMDNCAKNVIWHKRANGKVSSGQGLTPWSRKAGMVAYWILYSTWGVMEALSERYLNGHGQRFFFFCAIS